MTSPWHALSTPRKPPSPGCTRRWPMWVSSITSSWHGSMISTPRWIRRVSPFSFTTIGLTMEFLCSFLESMHVWVLYDDVSKWKHFPRYWPFMWGIHRSPVNSPHKGQWRGALTFFLDLRLNKRLSKQSCGWWFETPSRTLWRHCNAFSSAMHVTPAQEKAFRYYKKNSMSIEILKEDTLQKVHFRVKNKVSHYCDVTWAVGCPKSDWYRLGNNVFRLTRKETSQFRITAPLWWEIHWWGDDDSPHKGTSNAKNILCHNVKEEHE